MEREKTLMREDGIDNVEYEEKLNGKEKNVKKRTNA